jgi:acetoin:2,6-dichlorophenolindophenol oxidoreductase subunit alpha
MYVAEVDEEATVVDNSPIGGALPEQLYRTVRLIRRFEERAMELADSGDIGCGLHPCVGQEAVAAGVCAALHADDVVLSNHRGHGHFLARGSDPARFLAELAGRVTGTNRGRAGAFHPSDQEAGIMISTSTVGHSVAIATGVAWALDRQPGNRVVVTFFGDGAVNQGALLEALNLASLWRVPIVFVCENNRFATTVPVETAVAGTIVGRGEAFGIPSSTVDGMDPVAVYESALAAVTRVREGGGPVFLEYLTYRFEGHHTFERRARPRYRDSEEVARWRERDPLLLQAARIHDDLRSKIDDDVEQTVAEAVKLALDSAMPSLEAMSGQLYATPIRIRPGDHNA